MHDTIWENATEKSGVEGRVKLIYHRVQWDSVVNNARSQTIGFHKNKNKNSWQTSYHSLFQEDRVSRSDLGSAVHKNINFSGHIAMAAFVITTTKFRWSL
jgi:hypothetical protein